MATNGTIRSSDALLTDDQQASGQSLFWALVAIVFNAMQQPSFCGYLWGGDAFETTAWPHRSSPTVCILDAVAEAWILVDKRRNPESDHYATLTIAKPTVITTRLSIFAVAVLPQAIKLFSMKGIPVTQALAAVYFTASLVSMVRGTFIEAPHADLSKLKDRIKTSKRRWHPETLAGFLSWVPHCIGLLLTWYHISTKATITTTELVHNLVAWITAITTIAFAAYFLQHIIIMLMGMKPPIPRYPIIILALVTSNFGIDDLMKAPSQRRAKQGDRLRFATTLLLDVFLCSYVIAHLLEILAKSLLSWTARITQPVGIENEQGMAAESISGGPRASFNTPDALGAVGDTPATATDMQTIAGRSNSQDSTVAVTPDVAGLSHSTNTQDHGPETGAPTADQSIDKDIPLPTVEADSSLPTVEKISTPLALPDGSSDEEKAATNEKIPAQNMPKDDNSPFFINIIGGIGVAIVLVLMYAGLFDLYAPNTRETSEQSAAERGTLGQHPVEPTAPFGMPLVLWRLLVIINMPLRFLVRWTLILLGRMYLAGKSLYVYTFNWFVYQVRSRSKDTLMVALGIANFMTAVVFYLVLFDGTGTYTPGWTTIFG
ncbi:hypothetical protein GQ53DRAFT_817303 [Thozetella sp. PMI_491]|nr:hypothetical protein GQ53DRAFT_817303 [Thozetella sp. PMI_491]